MDRKTGGGWELVAQEINVLKPRDKKSKRPSCPAARKILKNKLLY